MFPQHSSTHDNSTASHTCYPSSSAFTIFHFQILYLIPLADQQHLSEAMCGILVLECSESLWCGTLRPHRNIWKNVPDSVKSHFLHNMLCFSWMKLEYKSNCQGLAIWSNVWHFGFGVFWVALCSCVCNALAFDRYSYVQRSSSTNITISSTTGWVGSNNKYNKITHHPQFGNSLQLNSMRCVA